MDCFVYLSFPFHFSSSFVPSSSSSRFISTSCLVKFLQVDHPTILQGVFFIFRRLSAGGWAAWASRASITNWLVCIWTLVVVPVFKLLNLASFHLTDLVQHGALQSVPLGLACTVVPRSHPIRTSNFLAKVWTRALSSTSQNPRSSLWNVLWLAQTKVETSSCCVVSKPTWRVAMHLPTSTKESSTLTVFTTTSCEQLYTISVVIILFQLTYDYVKAK